jgi:hypothetical protein
MRSNDGLRAGRTGAALLAALSLFWVAATYAGVEETFSTNDLIAFSGAAVAATLVEIGIISAVSRRAASRAATEAVVAGFIVVNAWSFHLVLVEAFIEAALAVKLVALAAGAFIAFAIVQMANASSTLRKLVFLGVAALIAGAAVAPRLGAPPAAEDAGEGNFGAPRAPGMTASPKIRKVDFLAKPNVYLIGFESAGAAAVLKRYLGLDDYALAQSFADNGFRMLRNAFTENAPTRNSFNALLAMERDYFLSIVEGGPDHLFQGIRPSPLLEIFAHNGYETTTLYQRSYFGGDKGAFVDHYEVNEEFSVCDFMDAAYRRFTFFGACYLLASRNLFPKNPKVAGAEVEFLLTKLDEATRRQRPQLFIGHIRPPRHPDTSFRPTEENIRAFRETYDNLSRRAAENLTRIRGLIEARGEDSILLVFGDHGPFLSRRFAFDEDPDFVVQDRYGVIAGIHPSDACAEHWQAAPPDGPITIPEAARLIVRCLAGGVDPFVQPYAHAAYDGARRIDLGAYRYE